MNNFQGRVFLISGGARGLGEAQARRLVAAGARVVIGDVLVAEGQRLAAELGEPCTFQPLEVSDPAQWQAAVTLACGQGALHGLVNNAGIFEPEPLMQTAVENFERQVCVNQLGTMLGMQAVVPALERTGQGSIVNISSTAGLRAAPGAFAYSATKWAVRGMTKAAAIDLAPKHIRVNSVHPGPIDTDMMRGRSADETRLRTERIPMKRYGTADEVAGLVIYLLGDDSRYMTGAELSMDGGLSL
jgi:3alpha(or 20beta)-hydroxysteroid dehydrogenase